MENIRENVSKITFEIAGIVEKENGPAEKVLGYPVIGNDEGLPDLRKFYENALITIGQIKDPQPRENLFGQLIDLAYNLPLVISPIAYISQHAVIGEGTIVMHNAIVNAGAKVGKNCILNNKFLVDHDIILGSHSHLATGSNF